MSVRYLKLRFNALRFSIEFPLDDLLYKRPEFSYLPAALIVSLYKFKAPTIMPLQNPLFTGYRRIATPDKFNLFHRLHTLLFP